jgi:chromate transporter
VALSQVLPGPASSQAGITIGLIRGGIWGAVAAWLGFTLPSAALMIAFGYFARMPEIAEFARPLHGLLIAAVAIVAQAVVGMARGFILSIWHALMALAATAALLTLHGSWVVIVIIIIAGLLGWKALPRTETTLALRHIPTPWPRWMSNLAAVSFFALLALLPVAAHLTGIHAIAVFDRFYRVGALVFGSGPVVLPMLAHEVVPTGWVSQSTFMAGYGAAQALPGPLFTYAAYLGTVMNGSPSGWSGGLLTLGAIFLPSFLMVIGIFPHWTALRRNRDASAALAGINAAVVGLLLAAFYNPVWVTGIHTMLDFAIAVAGFGALQFKRVPTWTVVAGAVIAATVIG